MFLSIHHKNAYLYALSSTKTNFINSRLEESRTPISEQELIIMLRGKERQGFAILYDRYSAALYGIILKIVQIEDIAKDILQDSFVKIWKNIESYNAERGTLFTWILNIARNTAIDKIRSQEYKQGIKTKSIESNTLDSRTSVKQAVEHIGLKKVVSELKAEYKEVIEIIYFRGYTHTEAAEELKLPLGTVKTRVKIALRELRKIIYQ